MIQFGLILVLRSLELGINEAAVIPTPGLEWLLLGSLLTKSLPLGQGPHSQGAWSLVGRCHHSYTVGLTSMQKTRPMAGPCPPLISPTKQSSQPPARAGVAMGGVGTAHRHLQLAGGET